ncbi:hypothetical protein [Dyella psychrodurans]|uniref:Uncharacterized protein n=1 Tax=Dyella psychrodurans TaxID=1927960 RepID=A0A370XDQ3_9GAMM|nr:hypothetical protein [Dyella psychrodurans]RDS86355.1 hypothetical protein DWU99_03610 [Dyella psychrodurans]
MDKQSADRIKELIESAARADASKKLEEQGEAQKRARFLQDFLKLRTEVIKPAFEDFANEIRKYDLNAGINSQDAVVADRREMLKNARIQIDIGKHANLGWGHLAFECLVDRLVVAAEWAPQREKPSETAIKKNLQLTDVSTALITETLVGMLEIMLTRK